MYIKFLKHGKGDPAKAASYLVDEVDHLNRPRADVQVLSGDPQAFTALAESIENEWKYTSGVIAWSKDDAPTNQEINEVLDHFEKHAFSGLQPDQYHFTAVLHQEDDGSKHVHFLVPRIELDTGKALNIAPPGHEKYFDPLRDYFNYSKVGLKGKSANDVRELIGSYIEQRIEHGFVRNRTDVLNAISELGEVARQGNNFISLKLDGADKSVRLKGAFYESKFSVESYIKNRTRKANDANASREHRAISREHSALAEQCKAKLTTLSSRRSTYNRERYQPLSASPKEPRFIPIREQEFSPSPTATDARNNHTIEGPSRATQPFKNSISSTQQHEPRDRGNITTQEKPFYIEHHLNFSSSYFYYLEYQSNLHQQKQIQRYQGNAEQSELSEIARWEHDHNEMRWEAMRSSRPRIYQQPLRDDRHKTAISDRQGGQLNESRSTVIEDHRRTTESVKRTAERARESITAHSSAISDYQRATKLHEHFEREIQRSSADRREISADRAAAIRTNYLREFFTENTRGLTATTTATFNQFSRELADREQSQSINRTSRSEYFANDSGERNRVSAKANHRRNDRENSLTRALSTKVSGFNSTNIFKALDQLDKRKELQREKERKNNRGYDYFSSLF
ncbi:DNA relaxase mbeA [Habropoda laboriosa]|uniref:DNA relaxase mbeA n=1 Tax=Habropoda laboriosa TaxID=597456 RepID=A0A0L7QJG2_9HYME|nr:DNA relaxase mbeA [Habropoda laboriosa]